MTLVDLRTAFDVIIEKHKLANAFYYCYLNSRGNWKRQKRLRAMLQEGLSHYNQGQFQLAHEIFCKALAFEVNPHAYYSRGKSFMSMGKGICAIHDFTASIILGRNSPLPYFNRALCISQILSSNDAFNDNQYIDIKEFARNDFSKALELGIEEAEEHLRMLNQEPITQISSFKKSNVKYEQPVENKLDIAYL